MRKRTLSDLILALSIGLCVAAASADKREAREVSSQPAAATANVADKARSLAVAVLWSGSPLQNAPKAMGGVEGRANEGLGPAERALDRAAAAAGEAASSVEMPFFSFGSAAE